MKRQTQNQTGKSKQNVQNESSRREFLSTSGKVIGGTVLAGATLPGAYAAEDNTIRLALVGCGGRGTGAVVNALNDTGGPKKLYAMADVFDYRLHASLKNISNKYFSHVDVTPERQFFGMDAYRKAIDAIAPGGVAFLTTPPAFRPLHVEYAISKGCHVFMEKSFAVDAPGIRRILKAGKKADRKNLKVAGGLMSRHYKPLEQAVEKLHNGAIGNLITCWAYREHTPVGLSAKQAGVNEMAHQIRNYSCFTWLNGSFILDWLIHNIDVCCWCKDAWPVSAQGQGGRQLRTKPDQLFDHYAVEYSFADGTRLFAQGRHMDNCWGFFGDVIHGTTGSAVLGEGITIPRIYKGHQQNDKNLTWKYEGPRHNAYDEEHKLLFEAIRQNKPYNETEHCAYAALAGILGRMAAESGQMITWEQALNSNLELAPGLDRFTMDSKPPVEPDARGSYPVAMPGKTKVL